jgi:hypothetical protein
VLFCVLRITGKPLSFSQIVKSNIHRAIGNIDSRKIQYKFESCCVRDDSIRIKIIIRISLYISPRFCEADLLCIHTVRNIIKTLTISSCISLISLRIIEYPYKFCSSYLFSQVSLINITRNYFCSSLRRSFVDKTWKKIFNILSYTSPSQSQEKYSQEYKYTQQTQYFFYTYKIFLYWRE